MNLNIGRLMRLVPVTPEADVNFTHLAIHAILLIMP
jgi:hypothetical protein